MTSKPNFTRAFAEAQTGRGHRFEDASLLSKFSVYASKQNAVVQIVEVFELRDEIEVPRIDLSLYCDKPFCGTASERIATFSVRLEKMLEHATAERRAFLYDVWIADAA